MMVQAHEQMVRECAYYLWIDAGRMDGMAHEHWIAAERVVARKAPSFDALPETAGPAAKKKVAAKAAKPVQTAARAAAGSTKTAKSKSVPVLAGKLGAKSAGKTVAKSQVQAFGATTH